MLITNFEHVRNVEPLIYKILLSCRKQRQIFQASKGFSGNFKKYGYVNDSVNKYGKVNDSIKYSTVRETIQPIYGYRNSLIEQHTHRQMVQPSNMQSKARK